MKKITKLIFITLLSVIGLVSVHAEPFNINGVQYETLKAAVDASPIDGTQVTITMTEDVTGGSGVIVQAGKNLIIDFGGHRFETDAPMVGSTGTETQSFQLLKGSTVHMKNGILIPSNNEDSFMFIQNYSNLTLENVTIDASANPNAEFYAVSNNFGAVNIIGNTSIKVNPNKELQARAFDMCWAPRVGTGYPYAGGTQIVVDTTGKIEGMIELDVWGTYSDTDGIKSTLKIKNIDFNGTWSIDERLANQLSIEGGKFNSSVEEYIVSGYAEYTTDNKTFDVLPTGTIKLKSNEIFILKGKTANVEVEVEDLYKKYVTYDVVHEGVATYADGKLTGVATGSTTLSVGLGKLGDSASVTVYEVKPAESENNVEEEINEDANDITTTLIEQALAEETVEGMDKDTVDNLKEAVLAGKTVETNVEIEAVKKADIEKEVVNKIEEAAEKAEGEIVGYLNIDVLLQANGDDIGKVTKLPEPITITVDVDSSLGNVPEDTTRKYFIVRLHEGEEPELIEAEYKNGKLSFKTDRFSQYAYGYTDTKNETEETSTNGVTPVVNEVENTNIPKTGDSIKLYLSLFLLSSLGIAGTILLSKKRLVSIKK